MHPGVTYPPESTNELAEQAIKLDRLILQTESDSRSLSVPCLNCQALGAAGADSENLEGKNLRQQIVPAASRVLPQYSLIRAS